MEWEAYRAGMSAGLVIGGGVVCALWAWADAAHKRLVLAEQNKIQAGHSDRPRDQGGLRDSGTPSGNTRSAATDRGWVKQKV